MVIMRAKSLSISLASSFGLVIVVEATKRKKIMSTSNIIARVSFKFICKFLKEREIEIQHKTGLPQSSSSNIQMFLLLLLLLS